MRRFLKRSFVLLSVSFVLAACAFATGVLWPERLPEAPPAAGTLFIENVSNDTYVFPGSGLHDELQELVKAGLTPAEALAAATLSPARYFGLEGEYGSIAEGKAADLVLLRENPLTDIRNTRSIEAVVLGGRLYRRPDLDALLDGVEASVGSLTIGAKLLWGLLRS